MLIRYTGSSNFNSVCTLNRCKNAKFGQLGPKNHLTKAILKLLKRCLRDAIATMKHFCLVKKYRTNNHFWMHWLYSNPKKIKMPSNFWIRARACWARAFSDNSKDIQRYSIGLSLVHAHGCGGCTRDGVDAHPPRPSSWRLNAPEVQNPSILTLKSLGIFFSKLADFAPI